MAMIAHSCKECRHYTETINRDDLDDEGVPSKTRYCTLDGGRRVMGESETAFGCGMWRNRE